jgi:hypothetical protein
MGWYPYQRESINKERVEPICRPSLQCPVSANQLVPVDSTVLEPADGFTQLGLFRLASVNQS